MGSFYLHRGGVLFSSGICPDGMEQSMGVDGYELGIGDPPDHIKPAPEKPFNYVQNRYREYPAIGDQLDAIWKHLAGDVESLDRPAYDMLMAIKSVKDKYPKDA